MKPWVIIGIGIVIVGTGALLSVAGGTAEYVPAQNDTQAGAGDEQVVRTSAGEAFVLTFPRTMEGYAWRPIFNDTYIAFEEARQMESKTQFTFEARLQGVTHVSFVYEPEDGGAAAEEQTVRVEIQ